MYLRRRPAGCVVEVAAVASRFLDELNRRVLFLDGAMGTSIHELDLDLERDYLGRENCTEALVLGAPHAIQGIHETFLAAGCDAVETDTFNASIHTMADQDLSDRVHEINVKAAQIARAACDKFATPDRPRFVVGSMGPGTKLITLGQITWEEMFDSYREQARGLIEGGSDVLLIETQQDLLAVKCIINATLAAIEDCGKSVAVEPGDGGDIPIMVQVTIEQQGTMLTGSDIAAAATALRSYPIMSIGLNCATGPNDMAEHIAWLAKHWTRRISVLPNAGLPMLVEGRTEFPLKAQSFGETMARFIDEYGLAVVGGCCGTTPGHLKALIDLVGRHAPAVVAKEPAAPACTSLYQPTPFRQDTSILNVGERCNSSGSRAFKRLLEAEDWDEMVSLARQQMKEGSHVLDVNVDYAGRDNIADMAEVVSRFVRQVDAPLMLDSTQPAIIEAGLKHSGGKCIINSANLEDGEEKFAELCKLAKKYGAALVLGTIDEDPEEAMARTEQRKIEIAHRMFKLATTKYGLDPADIFFDPLVLPVSTGMDKDRRSALETIAGVRRIATELPLCQTTVGLSNVSFGLKPAARQVLNSVFLYELIEAGLTSAIIHVSKILPLNRIDEKLRAAALDLIYNRRPEEKVALADGTLTDDPLQIFIDLFPDDASEVTTKQDIADLPLEERLQKHIIDGEKKGLLETLDEAMTKYPPLEIINDHLLAGMKVVGELFGSGQMQLPFVLQSAEVMKMAVAHLEPHMEKVAGQTKGKIVLATVKGDVHDIGKNLVDIILSNNGYTVYNLGIKQPISSIIDAYKAHQADAIGLSGLLVKSVNVMEENLNELNTQGIDVPMLLGGAALSKHYCDSHLRGVYKGRTYHGRDAFEGLRIMDHLVTGKAAELDTEIEARLAKRADSEAKVAAMNEKRSAAGGVAVAAKPQAARSDVATDVSVPTAPFWGDRLIEDVPLDAIYPFVNRVALYRGQWQFKKGKMDDDAYAAQLRDEVDPIFNRLAQQCKAEHILRPRVVYGYWPCQSSGDDLIVYDPGTIGAAGAPREVERFTFPRQDGKKRLCISDFFRSVDSGEMDVLGLSCVTMGEEVSVRARALFDANNYTEYLYLHGFGVETAEALAELWHKRMRQELGIDSDDATEIRKLFTQHYRGSRYSFGYPACPDMSDQEKLFRLLKPDRIGCVLSENWQIDPEQSTSAIIVHHPEAKYFNV
ncbi:MAG: methionine synthase [Phycisphaera sp.]|nr:methionine synthase [Phycisphaera sp.]